MRSECDCDLRFRFHSHINKKLGPVLSARLMYYAVDYYADMGQISQDVSKDHAPDLENMYISIYNGETVRVSTYFIIIPTLIKNLNIIY